MYTSASRISVPAPLADGTIASELYFYMIVDTVYSHSYIFEVSIIMNSNQISCFLETAKENNFTKAAANLYLSQPNLSRSIAALEKELDVKLFIRHPDKSISLTPEGKLYYNCFSHYRTELEKIRSKCDAMRHTKRTLRIGYAIGWNLSDYLPEKLAQLAKKYPEIDVELECHHIDQLPLKLADHSIDACLTIENPRLQDPNILFRKIYNLPKIIIYSSRHLKSASETMSLSDFYGKKLYIFQSSLIPALKKELQLFFAPYGFFPDFKYVPNQETMISAVENGLGIAVMDMWSQPVHSNHISWLPLPYSHTVVFAYTTDNETPYIRDLCNLLQQNLII